MNVQHGLTADQQRYSIYKNFERILKGLEKGHRVDYTLPTEASSENTFFLYTKNGKKNSQADTLEKVKEYLQQHSDLLEVEDPLLKETFKMRFDRLVEIRSKNLEKRRNSWFIRKQDKAIIDQRIRELKAIRAIQIESKLPFSEFIPCSPSQAVTNPVVNKPLRPRPMTRLIPSKSDHASLSLDIPSNEALTSTASPSSINNSPTLIPPPPFINIETSALSSPSTSSQSTSPTDAPVSPQLPKPKRFIGQRPHSEIPEKPKGSQITDLQEYVAILEGILALYEQFKNIKSEIQVNQQFFKEQADSIEKYEMDSKLMKQAIRHNKSLKIQLSTSKEFFEALLFTEDDFAAKKIDGKYAHFKLAYQLETCEKLLAEAKREKETLQNAKEELEARLEPLLTTQPLFKELPENDSAKLIDLIGNHIKIYLRRISSATNTNASPARSHSRLNSAPSTPSDSSDTAKGFAALIKEAPQGLQMIIQRPGDQFIKLMTILN